MRKEFKLNEEQYAKLIEACKPVPYMIIGGVEPKSQQENANDAWEHLGKEMGFEYMSVEPVRGKDSRYFTARAKE